MRCLFVCFFVCFCLFACLSFFVYCMFVCTLYIVSYITNYFFSRRRYNNSYSYMNLIVSLANLNGPLLQEHKRWRHRSIDALPQHIHVPFGDTSAVCSPRFLPSLINFYVHNSVATFVTVLSYSSVGIWHPHANTVNCIS